MSTSGSTAVGRARSISSAFFIVLGSVLALLSVVAIWAHSTVLDTDQYVDTMAPLVEQEPIQRFLTDEITNAIAPGDRLEQLAQQYLPERAQPLVEPIADQLRTFVHDKVGQLVASQEFADVWRNLNRKAHKVVVVLLTGEGSEDRRLRIEDGELILDLSDAVSKARSVLAGFGVNIPDQPQASRIVIADASGIQSLRGVVDLIDKLVVVLPIVAVLLLAGGVALAHRRRRALAGAGLGVAIAMAVLAIALAIARAIYLDHLPAELPEDVAAAVYDQLLTFLFDSLRVVFVAGLLIALGAWVAGPSRLATALRSAMRRLGARAGGAGLNLGPVGRFAATYRRPIEVTIAIIGVLVIVFWSAPSATVLIVTAAIVLVCVALVEAIAHTAAPAA
jgi:23S rRNA pseudoU1915 N3-methylase RlmH